MEDSWFCIQKTEEEGDEIWILPDWFCYLLVKANIDYLIWEEMAWIRGLSAVADYKMIAYDL